MSKIKVNKISESEVEVFFDSDVPVEMVNKLVKSFVDKGLKEDLAKSTLSKRHFSSTDNKVEKVADELIKSLENMVKGKPPYPFSSWDEHAAWKEKNRRIDREKELKQRGISTTPPKPSAPSASSGPNTLPGVPNKIHKPEMSGTVDYKKDPTNKSESCKEDCKCKKCADKRTMSMKKSWANHLPFPSGQSSKEIEVKKAEDLVATQLAKLMSGKAMFDHRNPTSDEMIRAGEQMRLGVSEEVLKAEDRKWNNTMNDWLKEATKPISQRFASEEEEMAYWNSIKVGGGGEDDGKPGY